MRSQARINNKILSMVQFSILTALVIVLQLIGAFIHIGPTSISLVLLPIVLGGMLLGPAGGAGLGLIFGVMTLMAGVMATDPFTALLFQAQPFATALICLGKGTLAGLCGGLVYRLVSKWKTWPALFASAAIVPIVNTGLFILGGLLLVKDTLTANFVADGTTLLYFLVIGCAGLNFVFEFILNLVVAPALHRVIYTIKKH